MPFTQKFSHSTPRRLPNYPTSKMMTGVECAACCRPIRDRFLMDFMDKKWHASCVKCLMCRKLLDEKCFFKEGNIYCRDDFYK